MFVQAVGEPPVLGISMQCAIRAAPHGLADYRAAAIDAPTAPPEQVLWGAWKFLKRLTQAAVTTAVSINWSPRSGG